MLEPLKFEPIYKEKVWGGRWLADAFQRDLSKGSVIGESWELACREEEMSVVQEGGFQGKTLSQLIKLYPTELLGKRVLNLGIDPFPLLIKFLDANDHLSVQVHPDDNYFQSKDSPQLGKTEMWYILDAKPESKLILGLKEGITPKEFTEGVQRGKVSDYLNEIIVQPGDALFIPAGTVHAIMEGIQIAEIQQNSDTTYRIFDWNRLGLDKKPRPLHIDQALKVIDFDRNQATTSPGIIISDGGWQRRILVACDYFAVEELTIERMESNIPAERFEVWMVIQGTGELSVETGDYQLLAGQTWMLPASLGRFRLQGDVKLLRVYIPDLTVEIIDYLLFKKYTRLDLQKIGGLERL